MRQTGDNCQEAKSQWLEKMLQGMAVLQLIVYIRIEGRGVKGACMNSNGGTVKGQVKTKLRKSLRLSKKQNGETLLLPWWVQDG